jgi:multicomponent Na+:H+ antiporter subunit C
MNYEMLVLNYPYFIAIIIFAVGTLIVLTQPNLIKKVIGLNIMTNAIFLFFIALGDINGGAAPIVDQGVEGILYINPLPSALVLTGIVVGFSVTALALALIVKLYFFYGTINAPDFMKMR